MHFLNEYRGLGRNNYILFIGEMMTFFRFHGLFYDYIDSFSETGSEGCGNSCTDVLKRK